MNTVARARDLPRVTRQRVTFKDGQRLYLASCKFYLKTDLFSARLLKANRLTTLDRNTLRTYGGPFSATDIILHITYGSGCHWRCLCGRLG